MRHCLSCDAAISAEPWLCPSCGWRPEQFEGFLAFAPQLASEDSDFPAQSHDLLDAAQERSFWFRGRNKLILSLVHRHLPDLAEKSDATALEIGCGTGFVLSALAREYPNVSFIGSEAQTVALTHAARRVPDNVSLIQLDGRKIPFKNEFDLIGAFDVIEHIEEDRAVLAQMHEATRPGGALIITVPQHPALWSHADVVGHHKRRYRRGELEGKIADAGFQLLHSSSFVSILLPVMYLSRVFGSSGRATNAELDLPAFIDRVFEGTVALERWAISRGVRLPLGGSVVVVARKPV